jgi:hypothetical protein
MVRRRGLREVTTELATTLKEAKELRAQADYGNADLTAPGQQLRERVLPFVTFCRSLIEPPSERARAVGSRIGGRPC